MVMPVPTIRAHSDVVHSIVLDGSLTWTWCRTYLVSTSACDYFEGRYGLEPITCVFCLAKIRRWD